MNSEAIRSRLDACLPGIGCARGVSFMVIEFSSELTIGGEPGVCVSFLDRTGNAVHAPRFSWGLPRQPSYKVPEGDINR